MKWRSYKSVCHKEHQILDCTGQCNLKRRHHGRRIKWAVATPNTHKDLEQESQRRARELDELQSRLSQTATDIWLQLGNDLYVVYVCLLWFPSLVTKDLDQESQRRTREVEDLQKRLSQGAAVPWHRFCFAPVRVEVNHSYYGPIKTRGITEEYSYINCWCQFGKTSA